MLRQCTHKGLYSLRMRSERRRRGLLLVEALVALVFIGVGLAGVTQLYVHHIQQVNRTGLALRAENLARTQLARITTVSYSDLESRYISESSSSVGWFGGAPARAWEEDAALWWGAHLRRMDGQPRVIEVVVRAGWGAQPVNLEGEISAQIRRNSREVVGYVVER